MSAINKSTHPLFTEEIVDALKKKTILTDQQFLEADIQNLTKITNLSYKSILIIRKQILNKNSSLVYNGDQVYKGTLQKTAIIMTPYKDLNTILDGGFITGNIYEICGLPASGKTTFCFKFMINFITNYKLKVLLVDSKRDFNSQRIFKYLNDSQSSASILDYIYLQKIDNISTLIEELHRLKDQLTSKKLKLRIVIIDSLPVLIQHIESVEQRNMLINCLVNIMRHLAVEFHIVVIVINLITVWYESHKVQEKVSCGRYWFGIPNVRLKFEVNDDVNSLKVSIVKNTRGCINKNSIIQLF